MALPPKLRDLRKRLNSQENLSHEQQALLAELNRINRLLRADDVAPVRPLAIRAITGPQDGACECCGGPRR